MHHGRDALTRNRRPRKIVESPARTPGRHSMHIIDSHFHWWPRSIFEKLCKRQEFPKARVNKRGGYDYMRGPKAGQHLNSWAEWFDLDKQFEYMDSLGHRVDVVCSIGPFSVSFSDMPVEEGRD